MSDFETQLIEAGRHRARCVEFEWPEPKPGKAQGIALGFLMSDGDVDQGRMITSWHYFTDASLQYTVQALRACGWKGEDPSEITVADLGSEVELGVVHEEWEGKVRAKVKFVNPLGGGMVKAEKRLEGNDLKKFGASMKAKIRAIGGGSPRPKPAAGGQPAAQPAQGSDDDIPF